MINKNITLQSRTFPSFIKYMGSKTKLIEFILKGIEHFELKNGVTDLFSGSCTLAGAIGHSIEIHSNDIQAYSRVLAETYTTSSTSNNCPTPDQIISKAKAHHKNLLDEIGFNLNYTQNFSVSQLGQMEKKQQELINKTFSNSFHFFTKTYSGTWWNAEQCAAIDSLRFIAEDYKILPIYPAILASIMHTMAYSSIGTGHYAQFRDPKTLSNVNNILSYRRKDAFEIFNRKLNEILKWLPRERSLLSHRTTALDYLECLKDSKDGSVVYADPPYCFVHYSRFYHALETLVLYDQPELQIQGGDIVKGRYRASRHQSPFCIQSKVRRAFKDFFDVANAKNMKIVLSYSNSGMISLEELFEIIKMSFSAPQISVLSTNYEHMTLGRKFDRARLVKEVLIIIK